MAISYNVDMISQFTTTTTGTTTTTYYSLLYYLLLTAHYTLLAQWYNTPVHFNNFYTSENRLHRKVLTQSMNVIED